MANEAFISHYRIIEKIGQGGLGEVFVAEDTILRRKVALKFLTMAENREARQQILAEARSAASIDHPYACKVFEAAEADGRSFIVMEFLEGQTLAERLKSGPVPLAEALKIATEISECLASAHEKQIIHCDLKPANVMITKSGHVKLMDFGLARRARKAADGDAQPTAVVTQGLVMGTPAYMPPEQARGDKLDTRADVFSFGIVLFEMLTGTNPYMRATGPDSLSAILTEEVPRIEKYMPSVPPRIANVMKRSLAKLQADRYGSARELWIDLVATAETKQAAAPAAVTAAIAILPFTDFSPEKNQDYLCQGLAEELITALGTLSQLRVTSRTSSFKYKDSDLDLSEIGRALKVTSILEGSVQKSGDRVRISVKLVDVETGFPAWSERYDRKLDDIFEIQDEISLAIVEKLKVTFAPGEGDQTTVAAARPVNVRAYEFYLKGRYFWNKRTEENLKQSIAQFEAALQEDPDYALALAGLADAYVTLGLYGAVRPVDVLPDAINAAERALKLNPKLPEALISRACLRAVFDWEWKRADEEFQQAIQLDPKNAQARQWYAMSCLLPQGQFDRGRQELQAAAELEPLSLAIGTSLGVLEFFERNYDGAIARFRAVLELDEGFYLAHYFLGQSYIEKKEFEEAIRELEFAVTLSRRSSESLAMLGCAQALAGRMKETMQVMQELLQGSTERYVSPMLTAQLNVALQDDRSAVENCEAALRQRSTDLVWLNVRPSFESLRQYSRVVDVLRKIGLREQKTVM